jgi:formate C-acetyltransferase
MNPTIGEYPNPSSRIVALKQKFLDYESFMCCQRARIYTEVYRETEHQPMIIRRALALCETLRQIDLFIEDGELIVGHPASRPRSAEVFPEVSFHWMKEIDEFETREYNRLKVTSEVKAMLAEIHPYWEGKNPTDKFRARRPEETKRAFAAGLLSNPHEWSTFAHVGLDYRKILTKGINGLLEDIKKQKASMRITDPDYHGRSVFYDACEIICEGVVDYAHRYGELVDSFIARTRDPVRASELQGMREVLSRVPLYPARTFHEALQSFWFVQLITQIEGNGFSISPGRFDHYMNPYLEKDLEEGRLSVERAIELLDCTWLKFAEIMRVDDKKAAEVNAGYASGQNLVIGGIDSKGKDSTTPLSYLCLIANYHVRLHQPNFTVRLHRGTPEEFLEQVVLSISSGNGMPQVLNDEIIVPSLTGRGLPLAEAREYIPVGCDEITVPRMWGRCNGGYLNFAKVLEMTLNEGVDMKYGIAFGEPPSLRMIGSWDEFHQAVLEKIDYAVERQVSEANLTDRIHEEILPLPFLSMFLDDCIETGKDVTAGGGHYNTTGLVGVGSANIGDSLFAIKRLVFDEGRLTLAELRSVLLADFEGNEPLRQYILNKIPKFGNDEDEVDQYVVGVTNRFFDAVDRYRNNRGGPFYPALYSVTAQVGLGGATAASADGRKSGLPLADGLTPMYGQDVHGPTAALKSVVKVDLVRSPNGVIVNQRLTSGILGTPKGREKMELLLRSFVDIGGFHWQFNIVDNKELLEAQVHPEQYKGLVVRVAGYSAIFIELSKKAQDSVIARNAASL